MEFQLTSNKNNTYNININLIQENIVFNIESTGLPKKIIKESFTLFDMKMNFSIFRKDKYKNIESLFNEFQNIIKSSSITLFEDEKQIELHISSINDFKQTLKFIFEQNIDLNAPVLELSLLYEKLSLEKNKEINYLTQKNNENEIKFEDLKKEINELKEEIKQLKQKHENEIRDLKDDYNDKINELNLEKENIYKSFEEKFKKLEENCLINSDELEELNKRIEKIYTNFQTQLLFLTSNDFENFKSVLQAHYNYLSEESWSVLFAEKYKDGYEFIIDFIFQNMKGKNGNDANNVIEHDMKNYKVYTGENWNSFFITNVIFQMLFSNDIELNLEGIEETLEKIYKLKPEFKNDYELQLKKPVEDIKFYLNDFKLFNILKGIKNLIIPKMDLIKNKKDKLEQLNEKIEKN